MFSLTCSSMWHLCLLGKHILSRLITTQDTVSSLSVHPKGLPAYGENSYVHAYICESARTACTEHAFFKGWPLTDAASRLQTL